MRDKIKAVIDEMSEKAGLSEEFSDSFFSSIIDDEEVLNEFITYVKTGEFLSEISVAGYTIIDIMVFQIDRFKAFLDRDTNNTKYNECHMILLAFDIIYASIKLRCPYCKSFISLKDKPYCGSCGAKIK